MLKLFPTEEDPMMRGKEANSDSESSEEDIQDETDEFTERCENIVSSTYPSNSNRHSFAFLLFSSCCLLVSL